MVNKKKSKLFIPLIIVLILIIISFYFFQFHGGLSSDHTRWGTFGDYLGGIFAFFAFIAVLYTINVQLKQLKITEEELKLSRQEMKLSRQEMKNSVAALKNQNKTLLLRNFESTYFELIKLRTEEINNIEFVLSAVDKPRGHDAIWHYVNVFRSYYQKPEFSKQDTMDKIRSSFVQFYSLRKISLDAYFRIIFLIIDFINTSTITEKKKYTNILRLLLTQNEQFLLFYGALAGVNNSNYYELFNKFKLFNYIDISILFNEDHTNLYD